MSGALKNPLKSWRCWAVLLLFALSFCKGWNWVFWPGLILLWATDRTTYQRPQAAGPFGKFIVLAFFLIWMLPVAVCIFGPGHNGNLNLILPLTLVAVGFAVSMYIGFGLYHRAAKRQEILKDL